MNKHRGLTVVLASMLGCIGAQAARADDSTGWVQRVEEAVVHGAQAAASGIERGAHAAASGVEHGVDAARRGIATGADAAARGVDKGASATAHAADTVAGKMGVQAASAPASGSPP